MSESTFDRDQWIAEQRVAFKAGDAERWKEFMDSSDELLEAFEEYKRKDWQRWLYEREQEMKTAKANEELDKFLFSDAPREPSE
jgi:hypothetical protein